MLRDTRLCGNQVFHGIAGCARHAFQFLCIQILCLPHLSAQLLYLHFADIHGTAIHDNVQGQRTLWLFQDTPPGAVSHHPVGNDNGIGGIEVELVFAIQIGRGGCRLSLHLYETQAYRFVVLVYDASFQVDFDAICSVCGK